MIEPAANSPAITDTTDTTPGTASATTSDRAAAEASPAEALGQIQTDRACIECGFNLFGQVVTREEHYGLPIARCPECGQAASLQEYPGLGVWTRRWSAVLAAGWLIAVLAWVGVTVVLSAGPGGVIASGNTTELSETITTLHEHYLNNQRDTQTVSETSSETGVQALVNRINFNRWSAMDEDFVASGAIQEGVRARGSVWSQLDRSYPFALLGGWWMMFAACLPWPVFLLRMPRWRVALLSGLFVIAGGTIAAAFMILPVLEPDPMPFQAAQGFFWIEIMTPTYVVLLSAVVAAALSGRALARLLIRAALPRRLRLPFAELWRADGKALPSVTGVGPPSA